MTARQLLHLMAASFAGAVIATVLALGYCDTPAPALWGTGPGPSLDGSVAP